MKFDLGHLYLDKLSLDLTSILEEFEPARRITIGSTVQDRQQEENNGDGGNTTFYSARNGAK